MTAQFDSWDSYFWEPGGPVLRNLYGERDGAILAHKEYGETSKQHALIETGTLPIPRTYDAAHLRLLHYELFKNKFEWAGEYRTCLLYTSDAADELLCVDLGGRRIIKKKNITN